MSEPGYILKNADAVKLPRASTFLPPSSDPWTRAHLDARGLSAGWHAAGRWVPGGPSAVRWLAEARRADRPRAFATDLDPAGRLRPWARTRRCWRTTSPKRLPRAGSTLVHRVGPPGARAPSKAFAQPSPARFARVALAGDRRPRPRPAPLQLPRRPRRGSRVGRTPPGLVPRDHWQRAVGALAFGRRLPGLLGAWGSPSVGAEGFSPLSSIPRPCSIASPTSRSARSSSPPGLATEAEMHSTWTTCLRGLGHAADGPPDHGLGPQVEPAPRPFGLLSTVASI